VVGPTGPPKLVAGSVDQSSNHGASGGEAEVLHDDLAFVDEPAQLAVADHLQVGALDWPTLPDLDGSRAALGRDLVVVAEDLAEP
jgi:hypothetical protein